MTAITLKALAQGKHDSSLRLQSLTNKCFAYNYTPSRQHAQGKFICSYYLHLSGHTHYGEHFPAPLESTSFT